MSVLPDNITVDYDPVSNLNIFSKARRVVRYLGSVALEVACFGIKSIAISMTSSESFGVDLGCKPLAIGEYNSLLLADYFDSRFRMDSDHSSLVWKLLYILKEIVPLKKALGSLPVCRGDSCQIINDNFKSVLTHLTPELDSKLGDIGQALVYELDATYLPLISQRAPS